MNHQIIIEELSKNKDVFKSLFTNISDEQKFYKPLPEKWCLLEVLCHLHDEEIEDFRTRVKQTLETPADPLPPIDPVAWVTERSYIEQDLEEMLAKFLNERTRSIEWMGSLTDPKWDNVHEHPKFGPLSAEMFLANWLAHDYLHFRQITRLKYQFHKQLTGEDLSYAGEW